MQGASGHRLGTSHVATLVVGVLVSLVGLASGGAAQDHGPQDRGELERARVFFEAGQAHFDEGRYELAIPQFERALALTTAPELLYNLYVAHERVGQFGSAAEYLRRYLTTDLAAAERATLRLRLEALEQRAEVSAAPSPEPDADEAAPPDGTASEVTIPAAEADGGVEVDAPWYAQWWVWTLVGGVVVAGVVTGIVLAVTLEPPLQGPVEGDFGVVVMTLGGP